MAAIEAEGLYKVFGAHPKRGLELLEQGVHRDEVQERTGQLGAVNDATFTVGEGELFVVMGLSGSGKSTLVRMINRLYEPTAGKVQVEGRDVMELDDQELRQLRSRGMSMVFQSFGLFPHRSVIDNVAYGLEVQRVARSERYEQAQHALEQVGLKGWEDKAPNQLSGGMRQRVGLARALATNASILLMDEPFSALDPLIRRDMQQQLLELQQQLQKTIMFITHDLNEAMLLGDRIAVMKDGYVVQDDTPEGVLTRPANDYVADFVQDVDRSRVLTAETVMVQPGRTLTPRHSPQVALRELQELGGTGVYVLDGRRLLGIVTDEDCSKAISKGVHTVGEIAHDAYPHAERDSLLIDLFDQAAEYDYPTAVIEEGALLGVIPRPVLLRALAVESDIEGATGEDAADATPVGSAEEATDV